MAKRPRTPQEKKKLSLKKDRRNTYGENDKSSRKNIARAKARSHRENRRKSSELERDLPTLDEQSIDVVESTLRNRKLQKPRWKKTPDQPLCEVLDDQKQGRSAREGRKKYNSQFPDAKMFVNGFALPPKADSGDS